MTEKGLRVVDAVPAAENSEADRIEIGQWFWMGSRLVCVTHVGSNYVKVSAPGGTYWRIHVDEWEDQIDRPEPSPETHVDAKIAEHREKVRALMGKIHQLTAKLGLRPAGELSDGTETSTALVAAHKASDVKAHKRALIKAKEKTLPDLFRKIEEEHREMAVWMKARLIPMEAEAKVLKSSTKCIEGRIFTVELYAGLCESVKCVRKGEPASNDEKVHLFQRRHYMDEECLVNYEAGGMEFRDIKQFDRWMMKKENRERLLPMPKCVVAFRVRRNSKVRDAVSLHDFIRFMEFERADKTTYLYIRNGDSYYRLATGVDFGHTLFPDEEHSRLLSGGRLYIERGHKTKPITEAEYQEIMDRRRRRKEEHAREMAAWKKLSKARRVGKSEPWFHDFDSERYEPLSPASVYYDDAMEHISEEMQHHNRIATVLQGLLDRSVVFHPHPPWKLWTPEGFMSGIALHYDETRGLTDGCAPDFEAYRAGLNESIAKGTNTVGQQIAWEKHEAAKENDRQARDWRVQHKSNYRRFSPYGNPGPGDVATVASVSRGKKRFVFEWWRERVRYSRWGDNSDIRAMFRCPIGALLNVDAYEPGGYKRFYADPRTRADYLRWAPLLLAAEDWHAKKKPK